MNPSHDRVLVAEDQRLVAADIEDTLTRLGYHVVANVASGEEAIAKALETRPDLALMDIRLRGELDGIEAATVIRERADIPIIYLTAYADEETVRRAMVTGPFGYLVKPFNERELRAAIDIAIYKHKTDRMIVSERARRRSAEEFRQLVDAVEDYAIYQLDAAGHVTTWNTGAERIKGYAGADVVGRHVSVFYTAEDIASGKPDAELGAAAEQGRVESEAWRVRKDGSRFWANVVTTALRDDEGQVRGFAKVTRDMTARRAAELELQRSAARMQAIMAGALDCIISIDAHGRIVEWNPAAEELFGHSPQDALGQDMADLIIPERLRARHRAGLVHYVRTGEGPLLGRRVEMPALTRQGHEIVVELSIVSIPDDGSSTFTGFLRDITARKQAEAERKRQEDAQRLLDQATVALASSLDVSHTLARAVRAVVPELADWCVLDMVSESGELGQVACAHVDPEKEALCQRLGREQLFDRELPHGAHHVFRTGKAELYPDLADVHWTAQLLGTGHPELLRELGVLSYLCVPVTFRGRTQGVLNLLRAAPGTRYTAHDLRVAEELARRVGLAIDNARLFREAHDAIRARDEFLQVASHELKTPLTPLQLQLDMMTRLLRKSGTQTDRLLGKLETATRQTARLSRLVESLLDISRLTAGKFDLDVERFDLAELVRDVVDGFQSEAQRAGSAIDVSAEHTVIGEWDRSRLERIISNLLSNAIKYGLGRPIAVDVHENDDSVRVTIADHGIGIDEGALGRIFRQFERGASLRHYGGLGLGLFIARQLAEAHGGTIVARSRLGHGSTFTLVLPRGSQAQAPAADREDAEAKQ
jgi:PAS domain S-box-containing protein